MDERIFANKDLWQLWTWLLMKANHMDKEWFVVAKGSGEIEVQVGRGQLVFGRISAGREMNTSPTTIWKRLQKLKTLGFCDIRSDRNYSVVTICNYDEMCDSAELKVTSKVTGTDEEQTKNVTQLKNVKNLKNKHIVEFDKLWEDYPNKDGKKPALKHFISTVKSPQDLLDITKALANYKNHLLQETWKRPKNGSTWFNNWHDWVSWRGDGTGAKEGDTRWHQREWEIFRQGQWVRDTDRVVV